MDSSNSRSSPSMLSAMPAMARSTGGNQPCSTMARIQRCTRWRFFSLRGAVFAFASARPVSHKAWPASNAPQKSAAGGSVFAGGSPSGYSA